LDLEKWVFHSEMEDDASLHTLSINARSALANTQQLSVGGAWLWMLRRHPNRKAYVIGQGPPMQRGGAFSKFD